MDEHPEADPNDLSVYGQLKLNFGQKRIFVEKSPEAEPLWEASEN